MGADSVLVNAAMKLGMSRVPGDTSEIFNKQYEGLIAYNQAKASATVEAVKLGGVLAQKGVDAIGTAIANKENKKALTTAKNQYDYSKSADTASGKTDAAEAAWTAAKNKNAAESQHIKENKQAKKEKLQGVTDILYGKGNKKDDKQTDYDAQLKLYQDKLDARAEYDANKLALKTNVTDETEAGETKTDKSGESGGGGKGSLPSYDEAWDQNLEGINEKYDSKDSYISDLESQK